MGDLSLIPIFLALVAILLVLGIVSTKISSHFNVPTLLLFLGVGMLAGVHFEFNDAKLANFVGTVAMCYILYSGGLDTNFRTIRGVLGYGILLATLGVLLTALVLGAAAYFLFPSWSLEYALLLGCIVSSTDAAAVFSILRSRSVSLRGGLQPLLELESGSNDPMAAFLTLFFIGAVMTPGAAGYWTILPMFALKMGIGVLAGWLFGLGGRWLFDRIELEFEGLYSVLGIALVIGVYGFTEAVFGNGFMGVYVCGLTMGNLKFVHKKALVRFHDGIAWLMQVMMFLVLGLLVTPANLPGVAIYALPLAVVLIFVARPVAVYLCMLFSRYSWSERTLISWVGLRGAAPIVLATFPLVAGVENSVLLFDVVFFIVIASVLVQGKTLMPVARLLHLDRPLRDRSKLPLELEESAGLNSEMYEFSVPDGSKLTGRTLAEIGLPAGALVMLIRRGAQFVLPRGNTAIEVADGVVVMADRETLARIAVEYFDDTGFDS
ncbi:MAG: potassium/proton antiporter [Victivallaceae bacterium]|nr:potassium/proton antiporter [Victivallaceae bacterium]